MRAYLENIAGRLDQESWDMLESIILKETVGKGNFLLTSGKVCRNIWYMGEGAVRMFEYRDGEEQTTHFFISPAMFTTYHSLITGAPSELAVKAEEDCVLEVLPYEKLKALYDKSHALERIGRIMAEYQFIAEFNRRRMHLNMDALGRYEKLESEQPEVFHRFQLKDIATYLGITPVSLSRLRKYRFNKPK